MTLAPAAGAVPSSLTEEAFSLRTMFGTPMIADAPILHGGSPGQVLQIPSTPTHGVGVYLTINENFYKPADFWEPPGYKTSIAPDAAGTILLAELPNGRNCAGNDWPAFCSGPSYPNSGNYSADSCQIATTDTESEGANTYTLHSGRFNYLFHDNHVSTLRIQDTVGSGTLAAPKGMWTVTPGD